MRQFYLQAEWCDSYTYSLSGVTVLPTGFCFSDLALRNPTKCVGVAQSGHHHIIDM